MCNQDTRHSAFQHKGQLPALRAWAAITTVPSGRSDEPTHADTAVYNMALRWGSAKANQHAQSVARVGVSWAAVV